MSANDGRRSGPASQHCTISSTNDAGRGWSVGRIGRLPSQICFRRVKIEQSLSSLFIWYGIRRDRISYSVIPNEYASAEREYWHDCSPRAQISMISGANQRAVPTYPQKPTVSLRIESMTTLEMKSLEHWNGLDPISRTHLCAHEIVELGGVARDSKVCDRLSTTSVHEHCRCMFEQHPLVFVPFVPEQSSRAKVC
jgi:hypothetical protein